MKVSSVVEVVWLKKTSSDWFLFHEHEIIQKIVFRARTAEHIEKKCLTGLRLQCIFLLLALLLYFSFETITCILFLKENNGVDSSISTNVLLNSNIATSVWIMNVNILGFWTGVILLWPQCTCLKLVSSTPGFLTPRTTSMTSMSELGLAAWESTCSASS